jgi:hypothetical protein
LEIGFFVIPPPTSTLQILILYVKKCACFFKRIFSSVRQCQFSHL